MMKQVMCVVISNYNCTASIDQKPTKDGTTLSNVDHRHHEFSGIEGIVLQVQTTAMLSD